VESVTARRGTVQDPLFERCDLNPILTAHDWPYRANAVFNPGVVRERDGTTLLLCRVEDRRGHSHLCAARSRDGVTGWRIDETPTIEPDLPGHPHELWGIEDPRITWLEEIGRYAVVYTAYGWGGPGVSLLLTEDFVDFERVGMVLPPENKDAALLPCRVDGRWLMVHRPVTSSGAHVWVSSSPDLRHWGDHRLILEARHGGWWDAERIGLSPPLIETENGWLMIYHGVKATVSGSIYRLGLALLARENPAICLRRGDTWVFGPESRCEREGDVNNVVFSCGYTLDDDGDTINLYYGAADTCVCLATASVRRLLDWLERFGAHEARTLHSRD